MRAGLLTEHLTFLEPVTTKVPSGDVEKDFLPVYSCRAYKRKVTAINDRDGLNAKEVFNGYTLQFQVRFHPVIQDTFRVEYRGRIYRIIPPLDYQKDRTYILTVSRVDG